MNRSLGPWSSAPVENRGKDRRPDELGGARPLWRNSQRRLAAAFLLLGAVTLAAVWHPLLPDSRAQGKDSRPTPTDPAPKSLYLPEDTPAERRILEALEKPVTWEFNETPLIDVVQFLRNETGLNIVLDRQGLEVVSVDDNTPISLELKEVRLGAALKLLLRPLNLTHEIRDDVLSITDEEGASQALVVRVYPVSDLFVTENDSETLVKALINTVHSDTWGDNGGTGSMMYFPVSGALVICQTAETHEEILRVLRALREARQWKKPDLSR